MFLKTSYHHQHIVSAAWYQFPINITRTRTNCDMIIPEKENVMRCWLGCSCFLDVTNSWGLWSSCSREAGKYAIFLHSHQRHSVAVWLHHCCKNYVICVKSLKCNATASSLLKFILHTASEYLSSLTLKFNNFQQLYNYANKAFKRA